MTRYSEATNIPKYDVKIKKKKLIKGGGGDPVV